MTRCDSPSFYDVVIVGGGHAGAQTAIALRQWNFTGTIAIVGDECELPYERPPLSKEYMSGDRPFDRSLIRPAALWTARKIDVLVGRLVIESRVKTHEIVIAGGGTLGYGILVWATGGSPRRLSCAGHELAGIHCVRGRADVDALRVELAVTDRIGIIGGGYTGLEAAAVLSGLGKQVTIFAAQDRVLARVAGVALSRFYKAQHRARGVEIRLGAQVDSLEGQQRITGTRLNKGKVVPTDIVVVGIGIIPAVAPLRAAGAVGENGIDVDEHGRTSLPDISAIGDCAAHRNAFAEHTRIRVESVQNANDQANVVTKFITGTPVVDHAVSWFRSNQYDLRLQTIGLSANHDAVVISSYAGARSFSLVYLREGRVIALDCVNATRDYVQGRALILAGSQHSAEEIANAVALKDLQVAA